ncbi:MAG: hypothetical protein IJA34_07345 [Lachnospiraceae bacterium]|nr:hypothetical protein [Lachnospiraceae bacterium]
MLKEELQNYELDSYEAKFLRSISTNPINMNNFLICVLSVLFPGISALVQIFISIV